MRLVSHIIVWSSVLLMILLSLIEYWPSQTDGRNFPFEIVLLFVAVIFSVFTTARPFYAIREAMVYFLAVLGGLTEIIQLFFYLFRGWFSNSLLGCDNPIWKCLNDRLDQKIYYDNAVMLLFAGVLALAASFYAIEKKTGGPSSVGSSDPDDF